MQIKLVKVIVGFIGFSLAAVLFFTAIREAQFLAFAKTFMALLVTLKLLSLVGKKPLEMPEAAAPSKKNMKLTIIGLTIGLVVSMLVLWIIMNRLH